MQSYPLWLDDWHIHGSGSAHDRVKSIFLRASPRERAHYQVEVLRPCAALMILWAYSDLLPHSEPVREHADSLTAAFAQALPMLSVAMLSLFSFAMRRRRHIDMV